MDSEDIKVDLSVFNPARIWKLYGTTARKGHNISERPHRIAQVLDVPEVVEVVPVSLLQTLAAAVKQSEPAKSPDNGNGCHESRLDVDRWLSDRGISHRRKDHPDGYGRTVFLLNECPFDANHGSSGEVAIYQAPDGKMAAGCKHNSCTGRGWREFKERIGKPDANHYDPPLTSRQATKTSRRRVITQDEIDAHLTDLGNAKRLIARYGHIIRYCWPWSKSLVWDGRRWRMDDGGHFQRLAKQTILDIYPEAAKLPDNERMALVKHAQASESAARINAMIDLVRSEPGIPVLPQDLDSDIWLLNVLNGTLDLRTEKLGPHDPQQMITKLSPVEYHAEADAPLWLKTLDQIFMGRQPLVDYLQRFLGHCLTGSVIEQILSMYRPKNYFRISVGSGTDDIVPIGK